MKSSSLNKIQFLALYLVWQKRKILLYKWKSKKTWGSSMPIRNGREAFKNLRDDNTESSINFQLYIIHNN